MNLYAIHTPISTDKIVAFKSVELACFSSISGGYKRGQVLNWGKVEIRCSNKKGRKEGRKRERESVRNRRNKNCRVENDARKEERKRDN